MIHNLTAKGDTWEWSCSNMVSGLNDSFVGEQWVWKEELGMRTIPVNNLPLFWLEVRWMSGQWVWRALNSEDDTRGKGVS